MGRPKYIFFVRHGTYDESTGNLDRHGVLATELMVERIKKDFLGNLSSRILYSPATRTTQTAEIYARILGVNSDNCLSDKILKEIGNSPDELEKVVCVLNQDINRGLADAYFFITHENTAVEVTHHMRELNFNKETGIDMMGFSWAYLIDLEKNGDLHILQSKFIKE